TFTQPHVPQGKCDMERLQPSAFCQGFKHGLAYGEVGIHPLLQALRNRFPQFSRGCSAHTTVLAVVNPCIWSGQERNASERRSKQEFIIFLGGKDGVPWTYLINCPTSKKIPVNGDEPRSLNHGLQSIEGRYL